MKKHVKIQFLFFWNVIQYIYNSWFSSEYKFIKMNAFFFFNGTWDHSCMLEEYLGAQVYSHNSQLDHLVWKCLLFVAAGRSIVAQDTC